MMKTKPIACLVLLNLALLAVLGAVTFLPGSEANAGSGVEGRGKYIAVSGHIQGDKTPVIWVMDQATQELVAVQFESQANQFKSLGYRNLTQDAMAIRRTRP